MGSDRWIRTDTTLLTAGLLLIGCLLGNVRLLGFAAVLIAVGLRVLAWAIAGRVPVSPGWARAGTKLVVSAIIFSSLRLTATRLVQQSLEVSETVVGFGERMHA